ncbi:MAG: NAD(+)/NADH kinase [Actinobacteria bacterium]|nr:NAD(+)/NADH kinase [Actinomycetota bacterium]
MVERFPRGVGVLACLCVALWAGWTALRHEGAARTAAVVLCGTAMAALVAVLVLAGGLLGDLVVVAAFVGSVFLARVAFRRRVQLPSATQPSRAFLFFNPLSGDGKAARFQLADEARRRGIEPVELVPGADLRTLVEEAIEAGADALAMAGGDGSQAIVAALAAERGLPYACIPAGTRNHFALDLGVDREDVVGSLDAFVDGGERRVDLAEVNGQVFVNNVSIGFYADAVQQHGYRAAKIRTMVAMAPEAIGPEGSGASLRWRDPDGNEGRDAVALLVSNNSYRLGMALGSGVRERLNEGVLGVTAATTDDPDRGLVHVRSWSSPQFTVEADGPVAAGIDGEASTLAPPIRFVSRPRALAVRIAPGHPGASPATAVPRGLAATAVALAQIAISGRSAVADEFDQTREGSSDGHVRGRAARDPDPR